MGLKLIVYLVIRLAEPTETTDWRFWKSKPTFVYVGGG